MHEENLITSQSHLVKYIFCLNKQFARKHFGASLQGNRLQIPASGKNQSAVILKARRTKNLHLFIYFAVT